MSEEEILSVVRKYALENSENNDIHGFPHVERVYNLCLQIGKELGANLFLLKIAAYLHDIGRVPITEAKQDKNHAENSAEIALNLLKSSDYKIPQVDLDNIIHMIRAHSFSNNIIPKTLETSWQTSKAGSYHAQATVYFDENRNKFEKEFRVGAPLIEITDVLTNEIKKDTISPIDVKIKSYQTQRSKGSKRTTKVLCLCRKKTKRRSEPHG